MSLTTERMIMVIASAAIYFLILVSIPLRVKCILKKAGKQIVSVQKKSIAMQIMIIVLSALLIGLLVFRELGFLGDAVICLVAILGAAMGSEEAALNSKCGLYENGIIGNGHYLSLAEIFALPALSYSKEEQAQLDGRLLMVTTDKKGTVNFLYSTEEEKTAVQNGLLSLNPGLAR